MKNNHHKGIIVAVALLFAAVSHPAQAQEASLYITPSTGIYPIGEPFTVEVRVNTGDTVVGTADATIVFEPNDLNYVSMSDDGSIFDTILVDSTREPGTIDISGFINRGRDAFTGDEGLFARLTFMPKRNVATQLRFAQGAATPPLPLTASVGDLTNVLSALGAATYTLVPRESIPAAVNIASAQSQFDITPLPVPTDEWFSTTSVRLSWSVPEGATGMRTITTTVATDEPDEPFPTPVSSVTAQPLIEGNNYFRLQFKFGEEWGSSITYPLQVDITEPSYLIIKEAERNDDTDPNIAFAIEASDDLSGVSHYEMSIDGGPTEEWKRPINGIYRPEALQPGEHVLTAKVYDRAGNSTSTDHVFTIKTLEPPILDPNSVGGRFLAGDVITISGSTYPNSDVTVYTSFDDGEASEKQVRSDGDGVFIATITEGARAGKYTLWFSVNDERGAASPPSIKRSITVTQPLIMLFGSVAVTYLSVIVPLIALILLLGLIVWLGYTWARSYRRRVKFETDEAYYVAQKEFESLRKDLTRQIGMLERANQSRELTREEMRIFRNLSKRLEKIETHIAHEISDIETIEEHPEQEPELAREQEQTVGGALEKYRSALQQGEVIGSAGHTVHIQPKRAE